MIVLFLLLCHSPVQDAHAELVANGSFEASWGWRAHPVAGAVHDPAAGASAPGSLKLSNADAQAGGLLTWSCSVELPAQRPARLVLAASVRAEGLGSDSTAQLMAQLVPAEGAPVGYPRTDWIRADCDWRATRAVFDVPDEVRSVRLIFFLRGTGSAWLDDVSLVPTDEEPSAQPSAAPAADPADARYEALARRAASEIPWRFDAAAARREARESERPILVYLRCTDWSDELEALRSGLDAERVPLSEDGFAKDVLFRAGPLSTPGIAEFIEQHFVPVCLTYVLGEHRGDPQPPPGWSHPPPAPGAELSVSLTEGAVAPGCLCIEQRAADAGLQSWSQSIEWPGSATRLTLSAQLRATGFGEASEACVMVQCWRGGEALAYGRLEEVREDQGWLWRSATFEVPEGVDKLRLLAYLKGPGRVEFDDLALTDGSQGASHVRNGDLAVSAPPPARLEGFDLDPADYTTPALVAFSAEGERVLHLHRQGTLSDELVARWLTGALELARPSAAGARVTLDAPALQALDVLLRSGRWEAALAGLEELGKERGPACEFRRGWCLARLGRHDEARALWQALAGPTIWGRKAAACLLPRGPRLHEALSLRGWPADGELPTHTEGFVDSFDPERSLVALLELQRSDGSFGSHDGPEGFGWSDPAITAIALEALQRWASRVPVALAERLAASAERALEFVVRCARDEYRARLGTGAFNNPYLLESLLQAGRPAAAARVIEHIAATQFPDGNWSIYGEARPASFNTAQNVLALLAARRSGLIVPDAVLSRGLDALEALRVPTGHFPYSSAAGHEWMTTDHGSIARDPLCEHALLRGGRGSAEALEAALVRYARFGAELRTPTKRFYNYFNARGHGGYYFFYAHAAALEASRAFASESTTHRIRGFVRQSVLAAQEGDGTFVDKFLLGRAYGTAQALLLLIP